MISAFSEDEKGSNKNVHRKLRVSQFVMHTGFRTTSFKILHGRKPRTELTKIMEDIKSYFPNWKKLTTKMTTKRTQIFVDHNKKEEVTDDSVMASKKTDRQLLDTQITEQEVSEAIFSEKSIFHKHFIK